MFLARGLCPVLRLDSLPIGDPPLRGPGSITSTSMTTNSSAGPSSSRSSPWRSARTCYKTRFGRTVCGVGGNRQSAQLMGLDAAPGQQVSVYAISGLCAAVAGAPARRAETGIGVQPQRHRAGTRRHRRRGGSVAYLLSGGVGFVLGSVIGGGDHGQPVEHVPDLCHGSEPRLAGRIMTGALCRAVFVLVQRRW